MNLPDATPFVPVGQLAPVDQSRLGDRIAALLRQEITSGHWPVGTRIPIESKLVESTGAGRNTVREAVQALVQSGMLRREQGRGTFVIADSELATTLGRRVAGVERRDGLELRHTIDSSAAALAAERRTDEEAAHLVELLSARAGSWTDTDVAARVAADTALHRAIVEATHNRLYVELYDGLIDVFESVLVDDVSGDRDRDADHHAALVQAIVDRDPAAATAHVTALLAPLIDTSR